MEPILILLIMLALVESATLGSTGIQTYAVLPPCIWISVIIHQSVYLWELVRVRN